MRVFKHGDSLAVVLPPSVRQSSGVSDGDELEFFELEPGVLVLVSKDKLAKAVSEKATMLLLRKAMDAPATSSERIDMPSISKPQNPASTPYNGTPTFVSAAEMRNRPSLPKGGIEEVLGGKPFAVLDEADAKNASRQLEAEISTGQVYGVRGFDNKFYIITRDEFDSLCNKILSRIQKGVEVVPEKAAAVLGEDSVKVACALHVLTEKGEALEKRKGVFMLLD